MACITPGTQKHIVSIMLSINAPMRPVVKTAAGGNMIHRKYRILPVRLQVNAEVTALIIFMLIQAEFLLLHHAAS